MHIKRYIFGIVFGLSLAIGQPVFAGTVLYPIGGGTGTSTPSGILYGTNSATNQLQTVTIGTGCTFVGGTLNCPGIGSTFGQTWEISGGFLSPTTTIPIAITATATSTFNGPLYVSNMGSLTGIPAYLRVGSTSPAGGYFTNNLIDAVDSQNDFVAIDANNNANGTCATADFAAINDSGTLTSNFGDFGHTSSLFTGSGCANNPFTGFGANSSYIFDPNGDINIAAKSGNIKFFSGGYATANQKVIIASNGFVGIATTSPATQFNVHGNIAVDNLGGNLGYTYFGLPIANGNAPAAQDNFLIASTSFGGALRTASITGMLSGGVGGNIPIQALNAVSVVNSGVTGNITSAGTGGSPRAGRYITTNSLSGYNVQTMSAITLSTGTSGVLASTTNAIDVNLEVPTISSGNLVTNFYSALAKGGAVAGTLTNRYAFYAEDMVGGTNRYAFYNAGATDLNYFAGNTGIGTTSPYAALSIGGGNLVIGAATAGGTPGDLFLPKLGIAAGTFLAVDATGKVIATTTPSGGSGTVTSVSQTVPSFLSISGSPVTTSGTLAISYSGTALPVANGGTGQTTFTSSQLLYGNGTAGLSGVATTSATLGLGLSGILTTLNSGGTQSLSVATSSLYTGTTGQFPYFSGTNTITATSSFFIATSGNIGIGSTTPYAEFSVNAPAGTAPYFSIGSSTAEVLKVTPASAPSLGVGTTSPWRTLSITGTVGFDGLTGSSGLQVGILCLSANKEVINESVACVASAARFKKDVQPLTVGLNEVMKLKPVSFLWKSDYNGALQNDPNFSGTQYSLIADEVQKVDPHLVSITTEQTTFEGKTYPAGTVQGLADTNHWVALFVKSIQDMEGQVQKLMARVSGLESKLNSQQKQIDELQNQIDSMKNKVK